MVTEGLTHLIHEISFLVLFTKSVDDENASANLTLCAINGMLSGTASRNSEEIGASGLVVLSCTSEYQNLSCLPNEMDT